MEKNQKKIKNEKTLFSAVRPAGTRGALGRLVKLARAGRFLGWCEAAPGLDTIALVGFSDAAGLLVVEEIRRG